MALTTRVWGAGKILLIVGALAGTYLLSAAVAMRVAVRAREVQVPDLAGRSVNDASVILAERGLTLRVDENRRIHPTVPEGQIARQDPAAGITARRQRSVRVWLSMGARGAVIPDLAGLTERTAQLRLQQDGIAVASIAEVRSADLPAGAILAQTPAAATRAAAVSLLVNRGTPGTAYVMPDLIGLDGERAASFLRERGFRVAVVGDAPYPGVPAGVVLRQAPQGGFQIGPGEAVSLEVSR